MDDDKPQDGVSFAKEQLDDIDRTVNRDQRLKLHIESNAKEEYMVETNTL